MYHSNLGFKRAILTSIFDILIQAFYFLKTQLKILNKIDAPFFYFVFFKVTTKIFNNDYLRKLVRIYSSKDLILNEFMKPINSLKTARNLKIDIKKFSFSPRAWSVLVKICWTSSCSTFVIHVIK